MKHKLRNTLLLTSLGVGSLYFINKCIITSSTIKNLLPMYPGKFFNWRHGRIFYKKSGSGPPLLLIHDLNTTSSSFEWSQVEEKLSKDYTVYSLDLIGCGRSDKPNITYTNYLYVQLVTEFIEKVIKKRTSVAATGLSGSFVVMACNSNPEIFDKLLLINPVNLQSLNQIPDLKSRIARMVMNCPILGTTVYHIITNRNNIEYDFTERYYFNPFQVSRRLVDIYHEAAHRKQSHGRFLCSSIKGKFVNINIAHALKKIDNSIFIISGSGIQQSSEVQESYMSLNPSVETAFIEHTKHLPQLEAPEKFYQTLRIFV